MSGAITRFPARLLLIVGSAVSALAAITLIASPAAQADDRVQWQNRGNSSYLEIWLSSTSAGGEVIVWPSDPASWNQRWYEYTASSGYYYYQNANSGMAMYGQSGCYYGIIQNTYGGGTRGQWRTPYYGGNDGVGRWQIINKAGCNNDPYWDALSWGVISADSDARVYLGHSGIEPDDGGCQMTSNSSIIAEKCAWNGWLW
ncbi:hypothetical protein AB0C33_15190 [Nonomuraea sp. NPDC048881]|uniref:RICIN domain-containing protein n=1 Tax=Nonomuraea sp. NPDC048881 TaxID=3155030 RepID=UPI0033C22A13